MVRWLVVVVFAGGGCLGNDDSSGGPYVGLSDVETATRAAECKYLARCHLVADEASCLQMHDVITLLDPFVYDDILAGKAHYRGEQMSGCLAQLANQSCESDDVANRTDLTLCVAGMLSGTLHEGELCNADVQCISQTCGPCGNEDACCMGTCLGDIAPKRFVLKHAGETCTNMFGLDDCDPTSFCDLNTTRCVPTLTAGTACTSPRQCDVGLTCTSESGPLICVRLPHLGETCTNQCGELGTYCSAQGTCTGDAHAGESCTQGQQCDPFSQCDFNAGTCKRGPGLHEYCPSFTCNDVGSYCSQISQMCEVQVDEGAPCQDPAACAPGLYCLTTCTKTPVCD